MRQFSPRMQVKIANFTRDMTAGSGDVSITGVGFKPTLVMFFGGVDGTSIACMFGAGDGTTKSALADVHASFPNGLINDSNYAIYLSEAAGKAQTAIIKSMDSDGFTLTWTKTGVTAAGIADITFVAIG